MPILLSGLPKNAVPACLQYPMNAGRIPNESQELIQIYEIYGEAG
jgi:hypothetical protein